MEFTPYVWTLCLDIMYGLYALGLLGFGIGMGIEDDVYVSAWERIVQKRSDNV